MRRPVVSRAVAALSVALAAACAAPRGEPAHESAREPAREPVVLLHGLALNAATMKHIAGVLKDAGFRTCRIDYPSRDYPLDTLAARYVLPKVERCLGDDTGRVHFVTHSMGGIIARRLEKLIDSTRAFRMGRVVMIAPPNQGSEVVDKLGGTALLDLWGGPAGNDLGTDSASAPNRMGPPGFTFGVIAATRSLDPIFSAWIPGRDDGKVAVEHTKLEGMRDFIEIPSTHTLILWSDEAARQAARFLREGAFDHGE